MNDRTRMSFLGSRSPNPFGRKLSRCRTPTPTSSKHWPTTDEVRCDGEGSFVTTPFARGSHRTLGRVDRTLYPRGPDVEFQAAAQAWGQDLPGARRDWRQTARYGRASLSTALSLPTTKPRSPLFFVSLSPSTALASVLHDLEDSSVSRAASICSALSHGSRRPLPRIW